MLKRPNHLDQSNNIPVELVHVLRENPIFTMLRTSNIVDLIPVEELGPYIKLQYISLKT